MAAPGVEIWLGDLDRLGPALAAFDARHGLLPAEEQARIAPPATPMAAHAARRLAAHRLLRVLLWRRTGREAAVAPFVRDAHAKPRSADTGAPRFSLAHSGSSALVALAAGREIGIDLEAPRIVKLAPGRAAAIRAAAAAMEPSRSGQVLRDPASPAGDDGDRSTLQAWTTLEAVAKLNGRGLAHLFRDLGFEQQGWRDLAAIGARARDLATGLSIARLDVGSAGVAAVAVAGAIVWPAVDAVPVDLFGLDTGPPPRV